MTIVKAPVLPYSKDHLAPQISPETLEFHHGKHHMTYFNTLKSMVEGKPEEKKPVEELIRTTDGVLFNNAAQVYNHCFYWHSMRSNPSKSPNPPTGEIKGLIEKKFGSFDQFKEQFTTAASKHFGSGWVWVVLKNGEVEIMSCHDADCPIKGDRGIPLLTCDVWEHAFYIDYRNAKPQYLANWWELVNWDFVNRNLKCKKFDYNEHN